MYDNHTHSIFSNDGRMTAEAACDMAIELGLDGIAFTDHLDFDFPGTSEFENIDFNEYSKVMDAIKVKYDSRIKVLKGIEIGIQPHVINRTLDVLRSHEFDYVLASVHIIDGIDPYDRVYYKDKTKNEAYELYLQKILDHAVNFQDYNNIGHFEYIIRYAEYADRTLRYCSHVELFDEILKALISGGKGFEINTGSYRDKPGIKTAQYDISLLKRYKELGGELISLGSDAHSTEYIGYKFDYFKQMLMDTGFKYLVHYEKRKPVYEKLY